MSARRGRRRAPGSSLPVEAPPEAARAPGAGAANRQPASAPTGMSEAAQAPRPQQSKRTSGPDGGSERALIKAAIRETRLRRERRRALNAHPELAPVLDLIDAEPEQYAEVAADFSARLRSGSDAASPPPQTTGPTVGPANVALEDPYTADLEAAKQAGDFQAALRLQRLRAESETRRRS
jgi:hypothetical protein